MRKIKAFTLIELLVVIAIISLLLSILMPAMKVVKLRAQFVVCKTNLHSYALASSMYLQNNKNNFPEAFIWLRTNTFDNPANLWDYTCAWHDPSNEPDGTLWPYLEAQNVHMCKTFYTLTKTQGCLAPSHDPDIPFIPQFSYSMNSYFGYSAAGLAEITPLNLGWLTNKRITKSIKVRRPSRILLFTEENYQAVPLKAVIGLNNNDLFMRPVSDSDHQFLSNNLATYHKVKSNNMESGIANILFLDGHVDIGDDDDGYDLATPYAFRN